MSNTPLFDAVQSKVRDGKANFHTPGHKGKIDGRMSLANIVSRYDLTEIPGLDSLYEADGVIKKVEDNISKVYKTKKTLISCGGATLGIQTMLALALKPKDKVLMGRNVHVSAINAVTLLDLNPVWVIPEKTSGAFLPGRVEKNQVEQALSNDKDIKAVYITSPDYYGVLSDIKGIKKACQEFDVPLLVDNAHGSHLALISNEVHPIHSGADMCVDSAHKTLPVLTGGAFLHINNEKYINDSKSTMALFGSTSPSYLMMLTIDSCIGEILEKSNIEYIRHTQTMLEYQEKIVKLGYRIPFGAFDISRFSIAADEFGYTGREFYWWLKSANIEPEMFSDRFVVLIPSIRTKKEDYELLMEALKVLPKMEKLDENKEIIFKLPEKKLEPREAFFKEKEEINIFDSVGKIAAESKTTCPPGMPIVMAGEEITKKLVELLKLSGVFSIKVVK